MKSISKICLLGVSIALLGLTPAFAETNNSGSVPSTTAVKPVEIKEVENLVQGTGKEYFACMARAASSRDEIIVNGISAYASGLTSAYSARKTAIATAWNSSDNRDTVQKAVNDAEKVFKDSLNAVQKNWNEVQNGANKQFSTARTECVKLSTAIKPTTDNNQNIQSLLEKIKQLEAQIKELRARSASGVSGAVTPQSTSNTQ